MFVCRLLFVVRFWLCVVDHALLVGCCLLIAFNYMPFVCCSLFVHCLLLGVYWLLYVVCYFLVVVSCSLFGARGRCSLFVVC